MGILEGSLATHKSYQLMSEKSFHSATKLLDHSILTGKDRVEIKSIRQVCYSECRRFLHAVEHLGIPAERLRRYAAFIQTCTSYMSGIEENDLDSPLCRQQGSLISARSGTYDYYLHINLCLSSGRPHSCLPEAFNSYPYI